jgi:hypothetical protein
VINTRVVLSRRPVGEATPDCFALETEELDELPEGRVRIGVEYISVDAGTRTMLRGEGFHRQVGVGETILAGAVGRIVESNVDGWPVGTAVRGGSVRSRSRPSAPSTWSGSTTRSGPSAPIWAPSARRPG